MSNISSPTHFVDDRDDYYDPHYTLDISERMRVPLKIRVNSDNMNEEEEATLESEMNYQAILADSKVKQQAMNVPDRIFVMGQNQHVGAKAPPRELRLEQTMMPQQSSIKIQTPPRVITLDEHSFPSVDDEEYLISEQISRVYQDSSPADSFDENTYETPTKSANSGYNIVSQKQYNNLDGSGDQRKDGYVLTNSSHPDDMQMMRRQISKLHRRVLILESDSQQRQQRDMLVYSIGACYFILKTFSWLYRNW